MLQSRNIEVFTNLYKPNHPYIAKTLSNQRLTPEDSSNDVRHLIFDRSPNSLPYVEGQSIGIIPPGRDANGKLYMVRLYSVASGRLGDDGLGKTITLCVKRVVYQDPVTGKEVRGVDSNYICDLKTGDEVQITGPLGKILLLPDDPKANLLLFATGTGVAPFRSFLWHLYNESPQIWQGETWLFFGVQTSEDLLYQDELESFTNKGNFKLVTAISREEKNSKGGRMYVQDRITEYAEPLWNLLQQGNTHIYMCGLRTMENGIETAFSTIATRHEVNWSNYQRQLKQNNMWHVETY